jgi:hypothetical protein
VRTLNAEKEGEHFEPLDTACGLLNAATASGLLEASGLWKSVGLGARE